MRVSCVVHMVPRCLNLPHTLLRTTDPAARTAESHDNSGVTNRADRTWVGGTRTEWRRARSLRSLRAPPRVRICRTLAFCDPEYSRRSQCSRRSYGSVAERLVGRSGFEPSGDVLAHVRSLRAPPRVRILRTHPLLTFVRRRMGRGGFEPEPEVPARLTAARAASGRIRIRPTLAFCDAEYSRRSQRSRRS